MASVNLPGIESDTRTAVDATVNSLDSNYRSLYLAATDDYASIQNSNVYEPTEQLSVEAWINITDLDDGATLIENGWDNSNGFKLYYDGTESMLRFVINLTSNYVESAITEDTWQHIAATYNKQRIKLYINGQIVDSSTYTADITYSGDSVFIGKNFRGYIDDIRIWDTILTQNHIKTLMFQVLEPNPNDEDVYEGLNMTNLKFYTNFNFYSESGNSFVTNNYLYPGNLINGASISNQVPYDNWFPASNDNWHTTTNWYSAVLPTSSNPAYVVINSDTSKLYGTDAACNGLVIKQNASILTSNNGTNKIDINGDIYNADIELNAYSVNIAEVYSSIDLKPQEGSNTYTLNNVSSNSFQTGIVAKGLRAFYFDDDTFKTLQYSTIDTTINFDWQTNTPNSYITNDGNYSILWVGQVQAPVSDDITFYTTTEGIVKLWVNDELVCDSSETVTPIETSGQITLTANIWYRIIIAYQETENSGSIILEWEYPGQSRQIIPAQYLQPYNGIMY